MTLLRPLSALALVVAPFVLFACPGATPRPVAPSIASGSAAASPGDAMSSSPIVSASASVGPAASGSASGSPFGNNFAVKTPTFSTDPCSKDAECAAVATCHSDKCVAVKNAGLMETGTLCTMDCRGGTLDCGFNHCGCAAAPGGGKRCALLPGPK